MMDIQLIDGRCVVTWQRTSKTIHDEILNRLKRIRGAEFDKAVGCWSVPVNQADRLFLAFPKASYDYDAICAVVDAQKRRIAIFGQNLLDMGVELVVVDGRVIAQGDGVSPLVQSLIDKRCDDLRVWLQSQNARSGARRRQIGAIDGVVVSSSKTHPQAFLARLMRICNGLNFWRLRCAMRQKISIRKMRCASDSGAEKSNMRNQLSFFDDMRLTLEDSINLSIASLNEYGQRYRHWAIAYSGGKDSTATVAFVAWAIRSGMVTAPDSLTVLYADTRMELPPLQQSAMRMLAELSAQGFATQVVLPKMGDRFYCYMFGRGVPPPSNTFRWCTPQLKIEPMHAALHDLRQQHGEKLLMLTGVRLGESAARDQRIALSCSKDSGECGQGWFQVATPDSVADTLAPLLHWRLCHVYDWLYFENDRHGYDVTGIAAIYGEDDVRTGCVGCNLASRDNALERLLQRPEWSHLVPLLELRPLYAELKLARNRKRKAEPELRKDGKFATNVQRMGPLTMEARRYGLDRVLDIQRRAGVDLVNAEEEAAIRQMWHDNVWPNKWSHDDIDGDVMIDALTVTSRGDVISQPVLLKGVAV